MISRESIGEFWQRIRNPQGPIPREPAVDRELERKAKKVGKTLPQLHQLGISDAQIRELSAIQLEQLASRLESQMIEQAIVEPKTVFFEPPKKTVLSFVDVGHPDGDKLVDYE